MLPANRWTFFTTTDFIFKDNKDNRNNGKNGRNRGCHEVTCNRDNNITSAITVLLCVFYDN